MPKRLRRPLEYRRCAVPIKSDDQLDLQSLHRLRERVMRRTAAVNQIRSLLLERGVTLRKGRKYVDQELPRILENAELKLSGAVRTLLAQLKVELHQLAERIAAMDRVIDQTSSEHEGCKRMQAIPGIAPVTATAIVTAIGTGRAFGGRKGFRSRCPGPSPGPIVSMSSRLAIPQSGCTPALPGLRFTSRNPSSIKQLKL